MDEPSGQEPAPSLETPEKKKLSLRNKLLFGGAGLVVVALVITGISIAVATSGHRASAENAGASHSNNPNPKVTAEATPSAAPTPENTPVAPVTPIEMPEALKTYQSMDIDTFKNIPENERIEYWAQIVAGNDGMRAFAADYYRVSGDPRDKLPETISENNTPEEIATIIAYGQRVPFSLTGEDRQKALLAGLYTSDLSSRWQSGNNALTADPEGESGGSVAYNEIVDPFTATSTSGVQHANNETYVDLELKSDDGNTSEARAYFLTTEYNGQPVSWWVIQ